VERSLSSTTLLRQVSEPTNAPPIRTRFARKPKDFSNATLSTMRQLPSAFLEKMQHLLGAEFAAFCAELEMGERHYAIRANTLKIARDDLAARLGLAEFVSWSDAGIYASPTARLGAHPLHHAGAFYVQEPSAQAVAGTALSCSSLPLPAFSSLRVLDLCAAPGGKSTHLAALMGNTGLLVCNEIHPTRAKALCENLERLGCMSAVSNEDPARLVERWGAFFDLVLLDAPCSGEGMFRKHDAAIAAWSQAHVQACATRQSSLLESAAKLLRGGGRLVYSTCTFSSEENEAVIERLLETDLAFEQIVQQRYFPHQGRGEGHFVAVLQKTGDDSNQPKALEIRHPPKMYKEFMAEFAVPEGVPLEFKGNIEIVHSDLPSFDGIKVLRMGIPVAKLEKNRLEPNHALSRMGQHEMVDLEPQEVGAYLRGETVARGGENGWVLLAVDGFGLGWGKRVGGVIKNHYPKHLRGNAVLAFED
jgi:16S rRNA C967 or C1407 C5-methylase (RsmB/RsmF family)/NOL1/NOP2/fmu family ribosome biogenesis protein